MTFNVWTFLLQLFNFLVLAWVLHRLLYHPLRDAIDRRRDAHEQAQAAVEEARQAATALETRLVAEREELERQRHGILLEAQSQSQAERQNLLAAAAQSVREQQDAARSLLAREREDTLSALQEEIVEQAVELSRRLLREAADLSLERQLVRQIVDSLRQLPEPERSELRRNWQPRDGALLETAAELRGDKIVDELSATIGELLGQPVAVQLEQRVALIAGARLRLGGRVWDASVAGQLETATAGPPAGGHHA